MNRPTQIEPWRMVCPRGHSSWHKSGDEYYCIQCEENFESLKDLKRNNEVSRPPNPNEVQYQ